jgi:hypothetical protein
MKNNLSKTYTTAAIIAIALAMFMLVPTNTLAASPKSNPSNPITCSATPTQFGSGVSSRTLTCSGKISGLGNVEQVTAQIKADVTIACSTSGNGNNPPGHVQVTSPPKTFTVRNGAIDFTASVTASANCPNGLIPFVGQFTNVQILINGATIQTLPGPY